MASSSESRKNDINVTPLVDVVFTLLIAFLVTMPVLMRNISLEIPPELADDEIPADQSGNPVTICGRLDGTVIVTEGTADQSINRAELANTVRPMLEAKQTERVVFVDFEDSLPYGDAVGIMDTLKGLQRGEGDSLVDKLALLSRDDPNVDCATR
jgi:biopolymer transport protein ExbD